MAFMHLGGDAGAKPTYFEVYAADKLVPTLKAAVIYSLSVRGAAGTISQCLRDISSHRHCVYAFSAHNAGASFCSTAPAAAHML